MTKLFNFVHTIKHIPLECFELDLQVWFDFFGSGQSPSVFSCLFFTDFLDLLNLNQFAFIHRLNHLVLRLDDHLLWLDIFWLLLDQLLQEVLAWLFLGHLLGLFNLLLLISFIFVTPFLVLLISHLKVFVNFFFQIASIFTSLLLV